MKIYYSYNDDGYYLGSNKASLSPADRDDVYLLPRNATFTQPPSNIPEDKTVKYNIIEKKWNIIDDPIIVEKREKEKLSEKDDLGIKIYKRVNGELVLRPLPEVKELRKRILEDRFDYAYRQMKLKFIELTCICMTDLSKFTEDNRNALKVFKDNIEQVWNSIDGTKKAEEIIWPDIPEI